MNNHLSYCGLVDPRISASDKGGKYLVFVSSRSVKMRGFSFLSLHAFWGKCVYFSIFWRKCTILFNTFVHFIIQKFKQQHTFLNTEKAKDCKKNTHQSSNLEGRSHLDFQDRIQPVIHDISFTEFVLFQKQLELKNLPFLLS